MFSPGQNLAVTSDLLMNVFLSYLYKLWLHSVESLSACLRLSREIYLGWREGMCTGSKPFFSEDVVHKTRVFRVTIFVFYEW